MTNWQGIAKQISAVTGQAFHPQPPDSVSGGCINQTVRLSDGQQTYFVKLNQASMLDMFEAEIQGLEQLAKSKTMKVPHPICSGTQGEDAFLVLEYMQLRSSGNAAQAGQQLAEMHQTHADQFGWKRDNTLGSTHQSNDWMENWADFWRDRRLGFQLQLAAENGTRGKLQQRGEKLLVMMDPFFDHAPSPSLLHGDLWGGNLAYTNQGTPVIFDPAVYFGDAEADLAMTELFGGFPANFYSAYRDVSPIDSGYSTRKTLYNLYHILNHLNIFGGSYASQAIGMIDRLLAELGH